MPNAKSNSRRGAQEAEKSRHGRLQQKSMSFHGRAALPLTVDLRRPKTLPGLLPSGKNSLTLSMTTVQPPKLTKLLLNVTIQGSLGAVQVVMSPDSTVSDLISSAVRQYVKEARRPFLPSSDPSRFDLHYSQFSLENLVRDEKLVTLGSRNFFLCSKKSAATADGGGTSGIQPALCSQEAEKVKRGGFHWLKLMNF